MYGRHDSLGAVWGLGRWRRVYAMCYGNGASYFVKKKGITFFLNLEDVLDHTKN